MSHSETTSKAAPETPGAHPEATYFNSLDYEAGGNPDGSPVRSHIKLYRRWRSILREPAAEFLGTMILVVFGLGVNCQSSLSNTAALQTGSSGSSTTAVLGWATGVAMGVWVSADISGGHINPVVTLVLALFRGFPWKKVPGYFAAQTLGAFFGSLLVYGNYYSAIEIVDKAQPSFPGTAALFGTYPVHYVSNGSAFFSEFLLTFMFILAVLAITRPGKKPHPRGLVSFGLFVAFLGLNSSLGMQTSFTLNPARDLGPRIMTWIFYGRQVWNFRSQYWLYTNIMGPFAGGIAAAAMHDLCIHHDEPKEEVLPTKSSHSAAKAKA